MMNKKRVPGTSRRADDGDRLTISDGWNFGIGFGLALTIALPIIFTAIAIIFLVLAVLFDTFIFPL